MQVRKRDSDDKSPNVGDYFDKGWSEYKNGFGDMDKDYWIGLETLYDLTSVSGAALTWKLEVRIFQEMTEMAMIIFNFKHTKMH